VYLGCTWVNVVDLFSEEGVYDFSFGFDTWNPIVCRDLASSASLFGAFF